MLVFLAFGALGFCGWVVFCYKPDPKLFQNLPQPRSRGGVFNPDNDPRANGAWASRRWELRQELQRLRGLGERSTLTVQGKQEIARAILNVLDELEQIRG